MDSNIEKGIREGLDYAAYRALIDQLVVEGKTTGPNQSEAMIGYTKMNAVRMKRLDKTTKLLPETASLLQQIKGSQTWLVITEAWCGDAAQIIPVIEKMATESEFVHVKYVFRDERPDLMDLFLTGSSRSIPMIIVVDEDAHEVAGVWGPRPTEMQERVLARKDDPNPAPYSEFAIEIQKWYLVDRTKSIQKEFAAVLAKTIEN